ncbi:hypothetical protein ABW49_23875 [Enterobacter asburiae]|nr:hypothetical protein ABW49_23875 [Enterobacter asburiae]
MLGLVQAPWLLVMMPEFMVLCRQLTIWLILLARIQQEQTLVWEVRLLRMLGLVLIRYLI